MGCCASTNLMLNFDVNKTIVVSDKAKNLNVESTLRSCIADCAWGKINGSDDQWVLDCEKLTLLPQNGLISYSQFIKKHICKSKTVDEIPDKEERSKINEEIKKSQNEYFQKFLNKGQPGEKLIFQFEEIKNKLKIPENILNEVNKENSIYPSFYKQLYQDGYMFIIPSFFKLLIYLINNNRLFIIIFRTFGKDFDNVIKEYNSFCEGNHPIFNGQNENYPKIYLNGENGSKDFRIINKNKAIGLFYRFGSNVNDIYLVLGSINRINVNSCDELYKNFEEQLKNNTVTIIKGGINIFKYLKNTVEKDKIRTFIFNDDYSNWFKNDKNSEFGKPLLLYLKDSHIHPIFFDDNIENTKESIVDCKNTDNNTTMEYIEAIDKYLVQVDTLQACKNENYFIEKLKYAEKLKNESRLENEQYFYFQ